jgi:hypothetical protein
MSRKNALANVILNQIIDAVPEVQKTAGEAREFWDSYLDRIDYSYEEKEVQGWSPPEQAAYWTGVAEGLSLLAGYNSAKLAKQLTLDKLGKINDILN